MGFTPDIAAQAKRFDRGEAVQGRHPLRCRGLLAQPATNAGPLLRPLGVISIKMTAMMDSTLMSTAIASGKIPPIASPMVTPAPFATAALGTSPRAARTWAGPRVRWLAFRG